MDFDGKVALITGAGNGIGRATALGFASRGAKVVVVDRDQAAGEATVGILRQQGGDAHFVAADVTQSAEVQNYVKLTLEKYGSIDCFHNNAGIEGSVAPTHQYDEDMFDRVMAINVKGVFLGMRHVLPVMLKQGSGAIVNTASVAAFDGQIGQAAYSASKGGVVGMTLPIARDLSRELIRVVTIAPGLFKTPLLGSLPEEAQKSLGQQVPHPARLGDPDEYGALAVHIVENPMLNGEVIRLDGAIRMAPR